MRWLGGLLVAVALLLSACGGGGSKPEGAPTASGSPTSSTSPTSTASPSSTGSSAPAEAVSKVLVFVMENHSLEQMTSQMPKTYALAQRYGYATDYQGIAHPSLPNYIVMASGDQHGITDDGSPFDHNIHGSSIFGRAIEAGRTAGVYAESMPSNCETKSGDGYAARHNPWTYFVDERDLCQQHDLPLTAFAPAVASGQLPDIGFVVPNLCHDAHEHECPLSQADDWLDNQLQTVFDGPDWKSGRLAVVITADEDDDSGYDPNNQVLTAVLHPSQHGNVVDTPLDHYSLYGLYEDVLGLPHTEPHDSASMADAFGLPLAR